jgi:ferredoxin
MKRKIITIDENLCTGCGRCIPNCAEGAIQMIDGKARLIGDLFCDGLGACLGHCPEGAIAIEEREAEPYDETGEDASRPSQLRHWPVQMHLVSPRTPQYQGADVLLAADCVAHAVGDFHNRWLKGKALMIACPKLDSRQEVYLEKIKALIDEAKINTLTVMIMEAPCCSGLLALAQKAVAEAQRKTPLQCVVVGVRGEILKEERV